MNQKFFISYCSKDKEVADEIENFLKSKGIKIIRDTRDLNYKNSLKDFMKKIRKANYVLMIISNNYLKSKNCMYEVLELIKDDDYRERILPIMLNIEKIFKPGASIEYLKYWENQNNKLSKKLNKIDPIKAIPIQQEIKEIREISSSITEFISVISDMKVISFENLKKSNFEAILSLIPEVSFPYIEDLNYTILKQSDMSHAGAKRYSAQVKVDSNYSREDIKKIIKKVTEYLRKSNYYRNDISKERWQNTEANVVYLFIAFDLEDIQTFNWVCRTSWISKYPDKNMKSMEMKGNDCIDDIVIDWNDSYEERKNFYKTRFEEKGDFLKKTNSILEKMISIANKVIEKYDLYQNNIITEKEFIKHMQDRYDIVNDLIVETGNILLPPFECKKYDQICQQIFGDVHNMFLYYSKKGLEDWNNKNNREYLMKDTIERYKEDLLKLKFEKDNLN